MCRFAIGNHTEFGARTKLVEHTGHHWREPNLILEPHIDALKRQRLRIRRLNISFFQRFLDAINIELLHTDFPCLRLLKPLVAMAAEGQKERWQVELTALPIESS